MKNTSKLFLISLLGTSVSAAGLIPAPVHAEEAVVEAYNNKATLPYSITLTDSNTGKTVTTMKEDQDITAVITIDVPSAKTVSRLQAEIYFSSSLEISSITSNAGTVGFRHVSLGGVYASADPSIGYYISVEPVSCPETVVLTFQIHVSDIESHGYREIRTNGVMLELKDGSQSWYEIDYSTRNGWVKLFDSEHEKYVWFYYQDGKMLKSDDEEYPYWIKDKSDGEWYCRAKRS